MFSLLDWLREFQRLITIRIKKRGGEEWGQCKEEKRGDGGNTVIVGNNRLEI